MGDGREQRMIYLWPEDAKWLRNTASARALQLIHVVDEMFDAWRSKGCPTADLSLKHGPKVRVNTTWRPEDLALVDARVDPAHKITAPVVFAWAFATWRASLIEKDVSIYDPLSGQHDVKPAGQDFPQAPPLKRGRPLS